MRYIAFLMVCLLPSLSGAQVWEDRQVFGSSDQSRTVRILSSTDSSFFAPIIEDFIADQPGITVEYFVTGTAEIDAVFRQAPAEYDIVISSAMDLQLKLANDGFAARLEGVDLPDWAQWHQSLFAFTTEPAAIVINNAAFADMPIPDTRQDLIEVMRANTEHFTGRVGTYDIRRSGLGYLFATQDARASETFWRLMEVMGGLNAQLYCCSGDMIDHLLEGRLFVAYNVLGSYAIARTETAGALTVILPSEFPTTMMRTALVSRLSDDPIAATAFVRHLIQLQSEADPQVFPLPPLLSAQEPTGRTAIILNPALMTYLDRMRRAAFIREWENAIVQREQSQ